MWQLFCNPFYTTMSAAGCDLQARNSFGTYMQPDWAWNTLPWQLMPQNWGMYLPNAFSTFTPGSSLFSNTSYLNNQANITRVSDPALDTNKSVDDLAKDIADRKKYYNNYKKLDSILKSLKDSADPAGLGEEKQSIIEAYYEKMKKYTTTKDKYEALKACYDELVEDNNTKTKIQNYLLSTKSKHKIDGKEVGEQLKSIGLGMTKQEDNAIAKNLPDKIKNCSSEDDITNLLDDITADNILEVISAYNNDENNNDVKLCDKNNLIYYIKSKFVNDIHSTPNASKYTIDVLRKMQTLMKSRAEKVLANPDIKDEEKTKIQALVNNIEDCTNKYNKYNNDDLNKLYKVLRQTEARILEDKLKKEYACLGESGLEINLVDKTNEDLKSEGFNIDVDTEVEATTSKDENPNKNTTSSSGTAKSSTSTTATPKTKTSAQSSTKTSTSTTVPATKPVRIKQKDMIGNGRYVYYALGGKTSYVQQNKVITLINLLDKDYVIDFLNGYYAKRNEQTIMADRIITQITTEYGWSDEQRKNAVNKIVNSVIEYLKQNDSKNVYINKLSEAFESYEKDSKNKRLASKIDSYIIDGLKIKIN